MTVELGDGYLSGLPEDQRDELTRVNAPGLTALREYLSSGEAVAFLGAGVSRPLYPLWDGLIGELLDAATDRLTPREVTTCRALAKDSPEAIVEIVRRGLGPGVFRETLRGILRVRTDPESGRSWTPVQELVCRCPFKAVVTTNYDPGIVDARMRVRPSASSTGFTTWEDELALDRWRTSDVFGETELPVLFAHGQHNRPDSVVLATTEYRRAYAGKLPHVLARLMDGHLVWIGFSFADQRVAAILREIGDRTGTRIDPGGAPRHVALMAWDPAGAANDPEILAHRAEIEYGAQVVLYPAPGGDHSALALLLETLTDARFPAAGDAPSPLVPARAGPPAAAPGPTAGPGGRDVSGEHDSPGEGAVPGGRDTRVGDLPGGGDTLRGHGVPDSADAPGGPGPGESGIPTTWAPEAEPVPHFTGRAEELARLDRWAADPQVALIGVTAWGGAGKTALVTHWVRQADGAARRPGIRGVFGWSFYADPSAEHWAKGLLEWARRDLDIAVIGDGRPAAAVLALLRAAPLLLVLDGLEVVQEGPAGGEFGRLLDGTLREVLSGACRLHHGSLVLLTSRFPFADLETFDGSSARMLEVPAFTPAEGAALLAATGGGWLPERERRDLVAAVDGHALAITVLAGLLAAHLPATDLTALRGELATAARTDTRVGKVLGFYADRLAEPDRYLLAAVSLFSRPVTADAVLAVAGHEAFGGRLAGWTPGIVQAAVRDRLAGLAAWHPDGTVSAHPLVHDTFRPLALPAATTAADTSLTGLPQGKVTSQADALRVTEAIELLLDAAQWQAANDLYQARCDSGQVWKHLPAARLGQRTATAFVATPARRDACATHLTPRDLGYYLVSAGLFAMTAGDMATAHDYLTQAARQVRDTGDMRDLAATLMNLADCLGLLGLVGPARQAGAEALASAIAAGDRDSVCGSHVYLGWLAGVAGDTAAAEDHFATADQICLTDHPDGDHLSSFDGIQWARWLARTGRPGPARDLTRRNADTSREKGWNAELARCHQILGGLALAAGDTVTAGTHLAAAVAAFRDGDYLTDLAETLPGLAACAQAGDLDTAERYVSEAISIAAPRGLVPALCAALTARALIRAGQSAAEGANPDHLARGRDAADAALRLATRHQLAWHELDALRACAELDRAEGRNGGWAAQADVLHKRLVPPGLDADPLATVERLVAEQKAAGEANDENEGDE
jgi:tetratricopeptide (TPR) repeat protein